MSGVAGSSSRDRRHGQIEIRVLHQSLSSKFEIAGAVERWKRHLACRGASEAKERGERLNLTGAEGEKRRQVLT